ncbi:MAG TPA: DUF2231 domain-containing protein [Pyrinomonadaceae bacterium]|jgi:uncharacterized membrane protein|nr:DUF2231 domain-containing protein [Pyrinomonadaceae bacterium]
MESRAKILGHPIHQILIPFPFGLLATAVVFDAVYLIWGNPTMATVAYWMIAAGIIGGIIATPFGTIDWAAIPKGTRAKSVGALHGIGNVVVLLLFIGSWLLRRNSDPTPEPYIPTTLALVLSYAGAGLSLLTGWLGGELVDRLSVGIDDGAHLDSPNSLSGRPASEHASKS